MNDRRTAGLALAKVIKLQRREKQQNLLIVGLLGVATVAGFGLLISHPREQARATLKPLRKPRRRIAEAIYKLSDCETPDEVLAICDQGADRMQEPRDRFLAAVSDVAVHLRERSPAQTIPVRRLVELLVDVAGVCHDYNRASRLVVGFLAKPPRDEPGWEDRKNAIYAVLRTAGTHFDPDADLIDRLAREFEHENLRFSPGMDHAQLYITQKRQDDLAVLSLLPLGVPVRWPWPVDSQQP
jgi:hypothetical protein